MACGALAWVQKVDEVLFNQRAHEVLASPRDSRVQHPAFKFLQNDGLVVYFIGLSVVFKILKAEAPGQDPVRTTGASAVLAVTAGSPLIEILTPAFTAGLTTGLVTTTVGLTVTLAVPDGLAVVLTGAWARMLETRTIA